MVGDGQASGGHGVPAIPVPYELNRRRSSFLLSNALDQPAARPAEARLQSVSLAQDGAIRGGRVVTRREVRWERRKERREERRKKS